MKFVLIFFSTVVLSEPALSSPTPIGFWNKGKLKDAIRADLELKKIGANVQSVSPPGFQWATKELVRALADAGHFLEKEEKGKLWVGDMSKQNGGKLARHITHQMGLDADIAYVPHVRRTQGHRWKRYHNKFTEKYEKSGKITENLDLPTNYRLIRHIFDRHPVKAIFVGCAILEALYEHDDGRRPDLMKRVYGDPGHEDHFHVRLDCPDNAKECEGKWYSWNKKKKKKSKRRKSKWSGCRKRV